MTRREQCAPVPRPHRPEERLRHAGVQPRGRAPKTRTRSTTSISRRSASHGPPTSSCPARRSGPGTGVSSRDHRDAGPVAVVREEDRRQRRRVSTIVSHPVVPLGDVAPMPRSPFNPTVCTCRGRASARRAAMRSSGRRTAARLRGPAHRHTGAGATSIVVPGVFDGFFAVSSIISGVNTMLHPLDGIPGAVGRPRCVRRSPSADLSLVEGDSGTRSGNVTVALSEPTTVPVTVKVRAADVSAVRPATTTPSVRRRWCSLPDRPPRRCGDDPWRQPEREERDVRPQALRRHQGDHR